MTTRYTFADYTQIGKDENGYSTWGYDTDPTNYSRLYLGDLTRSDDGNLYKFPYSSGSDYSGDSVTVANYNSLLKEFESGIGVWLWPYYGGAGTYGVVYDPELVPEDAKELVETVLADIDNYTYLDEDELYRVEQQAIADAWESWLNYDVADRIRTLAQKEGRVIEVEHHDPDAVSVLRVFFENMMELHGGEYVNKTGNSAYADIDRVLPSWGQIVNYLAVYGVEYRESEGK